MLHVCSNDSTMQMSQACCKRSHVHTWMDSCTLAANNAANVHMPIYEGLPANLQLTLLRAKYFTDIQILLPNSTASVSFRYVPIKKQIVNQSKMINLLNTSSLKLIYEIKQINSYNQRKHWTIRKSKFSWIIIQTDYLNFCIQVRMNNNLKQTALSFELLVRLLCLTYM